jgi:hypothetical protein
MGHGSLSYITNVNFVRLWCETGCARPSGDVAHCERLPRAPPGRTQPALFLSTQPTRLDGAGPTRYCFVGEVSKPSLIEQHFFRAPRSPCLTQAFVATSVIGGIRYYARLSLPSPPFMGYVGYWYLFLTAIAAVSLIVDINSSTPSRDAWASIRLS